MRVHLRIAQAARRTARWHVESQDIARRNAMVACTVLTQRRSDRHSPGVVLRDAAG